VPDTVLSVAAKSVDAGSDVVTVAAVPPITSVSAAWRYENARVDVGVTVPDTSEIPDDEEVMFELLSNEMETTSVMEANGGTVPPTNELPVIV
jgi:hypothetical protein